MNRGDIDESWNRGSGASVFPASQVAVDSVAASWCGTGLLDGGDLGSRLPRCTAQSKK
jgi:hypothetical protein